MADATTSSLHIDAPPDRVMAVIADFGSYPEWTDQITDVEIIDPGTGERARQVKFSMNAGAIKDTYTLDYDWAADDRSVSWTLVKGGIQKAQDGSYDLVPDGDGTVVTYRLSVEVNFPMIGMLRRKAEKVIIDAALKGLKRRVEQG
ncbi:SRPBCC family protein [Pseudonocardia nematodicida]|uniref:SRPBCC family protein n=1 Tax=Pseudonocardia nematodicida TaxID=1206997 RepID=A0ABV1KCM5_9PSEU